MSNNYKTIINGVMVIAMRPLKGVREEDGKLLARLESPYAHAFVRGGLTDAVVPLLYLPQKCHASPCRHRWRTFRAESYLSGSPRLKTGKRCSMRTIVLSYIIVSRRLIRDHGRRKRNYCMMAGSVRTKLYIYSTHHGHHKILGTPWKWGPPCLISRV